MAGKCTVDGKDNKEDKTREEADMTLSLVKISKCHIKLSLEMPEKITFSEIEVQSYAFYFWQLLWNTLYGLKEGGIKVSVHQPKSFVHMLDFVFIREGEKKNW